MRKNNLICEHPDTLLEVSSCLVLDYLVPAKQLSTLYKDYFIIPEPALVLSGTNRIVATPTDVVVDSLDGRKIPYDQLPLHDGKVFNTTTNKHFSLGTIKVEHIEDEPYIERKFVLAFLMEHLSIHINTRLMYDENSCITLGRSEQYIREDLDYSVVEGRFYPILERLSTEINGFIRNDYWHLYRMQIHSRHIHIKKLCDYRVYEWTCNEYLKQNPDDDTVNRP